MAYPTNYQDAEHRRALNAILDDLHTITDEDRGDETGSGVSAEGDACGSASCDRESNESVAHRADAELQIRTTRLSAAQLSTPSTN